MTGLAPGKRSGAIALIQPSLFSVGLANRIFSLIINFRDNLRFRFAVRFFNSLRFDFILIGCRAVYGKHCGELAALISSDEGPDAVLGCSKSDPALQIRSMAVPLPITAVRVSSTKTSSPVS
ncbi:hypothetical protein B9057_14265 (plasmid) [Aestuarium zhoushanense]|nr:hypothetical protein B9057_14265 [Aestuarium zhoushanense]